MPVKNNITGLWRHYKLANFATNVYTGVDGNKSLIGGTGAGAGQKLLKDVFLIVDKADTTTEQETEAAKMLVGTPKTKVVKIGRATDKLSLSGPMLFSESQGSAVDCVPKPVIAETFGTTAYGDASSVAAAMLYSSTNFTATSNQTSYADKIGLNIDENGANFDISMVGDPTSLYANFYDPANSIAPFGYDGTAVGGRPTDPLNKALRVGTFYDFYVNAQIKATSSTGSPPSFDSTFQVGAAIRGITMNISIGAEQISLLGMGQAPFFAINQVAMEGTIKIVFPLLATTGTSNFKTPVPTWQAVPNAFPSAIQIAAGTLPGNRTISALGVPTPAALCKFPDAPDKFVVDTVSVIPYYLSNNQPLFASGAFGGDIDITSIKVVMKSSRVNISVGVLEADMAYQVIFS